MAHNRLALISGQRFVRLVITRPFNTDDRRFCDARCDCGTTLRVLRSNIASGNSKSCGCLNTERRSETHTTHGRSRTKLYRIWQNIKNRCLNHKMSAYPDYGGRGITICEGWKDSFETFAHDVGDPPRGLTLDRINNDAGYTPNNVRWATMTQQCRNRRNNLLFSAWGEVKTAKDWSEDARCAVPYNTLIHRVERGLIPETAMTLPNRSGRKLARPPSAG